MAGFKLSEADALLPPQRPRRLMVLCCEVFTRESYLRAAHSPLTVDVELLDKALHDTPLDLRKRLQERIDQVDAQRYGAIALVYGLCNVGLAGLVAREVPLVLPRAHDCITLYLGSRQRYDEEFQSQPGTYWYSADYLERSQHKLTHDQPPTALGASSKLHATYEELVAKYGEDNAQYVLEVMGQWTQHYRRAAFIETGWDIDGEAKRRAAEQAKQHGWEYKEVSGDSTLVRRLLEGDWTGDDFLFVPPGMAIMPTHDEAVVGASTPEEVNAALA